MSLAMPENYGSTTTLKYRGRDSAVLVRYQFYPDLDTVLYSWRGALGIASDIL